jgi:hypothetical protein
MRNQSATASHHLLGQCSGWEISTQLIIHRSSWQRWKNGRGYKATLYFAREPLLEQQAANNHSCWRFKETVQQPLKFVAEINFQLIHVGLEKSRLEASCCSGRCNVIQRFTTGQQVLQDGILAEICVGSFAQQAVIQLNQSDDVGIHTPHFTFPHTASCSGFTHGNSFMRRDSSPGRFGFHI